MTTFPPRRESRLSLRFHACQHDTIKAKYSGRLGASALEYHRKLPTDTQHWMPGRLRVCSESSLAAYGEETTNATANSYPKPAPYSCLPIRYTYRQQRHKALETISLRYLAVHVLFSTSDPCISYFKGKIACESCIHSRATIE